MTTVKSFLLVLLFFIFVCTNMVKADAGVEHLCPVDGGETIKYAATPESSLIKKETCLFHEISQNILDRAASGEVYSRFFDVDDKKQINYFMIGLIPSDISRVKEALTNLESLDKLIENDSNYTLIDIGCFQDLEDLFPEFAKNHPDALVEGGKIYKAKVKYGTGVFKIKDKIIKHKMSFEQDDSVTIITNLISSEKIYGSSYGIARLFPYKGGTIFINYSEDYIKHPSAGMLISRIKKGVIESSRKFVKDLSGFTLKNGL